MTEMLTAQDAPRTAGTTGPCRQAPETAAAIQAQMAASDSLASRIRARAGRPMRDEDDIRRGARNFINDLAILAAQTDASTLAELAGLKDLIDRRLSEAAMILTQDTPEAAELRGHEAPPVTWSQVAVEFGTHRNNCYETFTPGVRARKAAARRAGGR